MAKVHCALGRSRNRAGVNAWNVYTYGTRPTAKQAEFLFVSSDMIHDKLRPEHNDTEDPNTISRSGLEKAKRKY